MLKNIDFSWPVAEIVLQHHERINGSGYPRSIVSMALYQKDFSYAKDISWNQVIAVIEKIQD